VTVTPSGGTPHRKVLASVGLLPPDRIFDAQQCANDQDHPARDCQIARAGEQAEDHHDQAQSEDDVDPDRCGVHSGQGTDHARSPLPRTADGGGRR
jgi:hypothetical protein